MTEAVSGFVDAFWMEYPVGFPGVEEDKRDTLVATTDVANEACKAVLRKAGFRFVRVASEGGDVWEVWMVARPRDGRGVGFGWECWRER